MRREISVLARDVRVRKRACDYAEAEGEEEAVSALRRFVAIAALVMRGHLAGRVLRVPLVEGPNVPAGVAPIVVNQGAIAGAGEKPGWLAAVRAETRLRFSWIGHAPLTRENRIRHSGENLS